MGARPGEGVGVIYGKVEASEFYFAAKAETEAEARSRTSGRTPSDGGVKRLDYISAEHPDGHLVLGQVIEVERLSELSFQEAAQVPRGSSVLTGDHIKCKVKVIGYRDDRGLLQMPRTPFRAGTEVRKATANLIQRILGLTSDPDKGVYLGFLKGTESPVVLDINNLVQKHVSVLAKTGAGKSYTVGVLIEELLKRRVPLIIIDAHGEYTTLSSPNIESKEIDNLIRFNLKPKSFAGAVHEYVLGKPSPGTKRLELDGSGLEARELMDLLPEKLSSAQAGLVYQAINELKRRRPDYSIRDVIDEIGKNPSNAKWPVMGAIETLETTGLFGAKGTSVDQLVIPGQASIVTLKGVLPEVQQMCVARLATSLFEARKKNKVPPFMFVVEEAHNYCPQAGVAGTALSGDVLRTVAQEGRKFGMGLLIVSQRPALVNKTVLGQCNTQIIMKVSNPNDLRAITASVEGLTAETADEIQRLDVGVALVASPGLAQPIMVEVRARQTRHGGRSVDVLQEEEPEPVPEPLTRALPPAPVDVANLPPIEHVLREAQPAPVGLNEETPLPRAPAKPSPRRPWAAPEEPVPPLVDGEIVQEHEERRASPPATRVPSRPPPAKEVEPAPQRTQDDEHDRPMATTVESEDVLVQRVVGRVGYTTHSTKEAVAKVRELAKTIPEMSPDDYVHGYARVGKTFCYPSHPECGPCPLLRSCRLGLERLGRGEVREGRWGTTAR